MIVPFYIMQHSIIAAAAIGLETVQQKLLKGMWFDATDPMFLRITHPWVMHDEEAEPLYSSAWLDSLQIEHETGFVGAWRKLTDAERGMGFAIAANELGAFDSFDLTGRYQRAVRYKFRLVEISPRKPQETKKQDAPADWIAVSA